jgi:hypothetical protein
MRHVVGIDNIAPQRTRGGANAIPAVMIESAADLILRMLRDPGQIVSREDDVIPLVGAQTRVCPDEALGALNVMLASGICAHVELAMTAPSVGASGTPTARLRIA